MNLRYLAAIIALFLWGRVVQAQEQVRPNIVIFIADDLGAVDLSPYGNKVVRTPHLEAFTKQSMLFANAFAASPTCGPSRSTLLTGLYPFRHGGHGNHSAVRDGTKSLAHYMKPLGYQVAIAGKLHVGPEPAFPFQRIMGTNVTEPGQTDRAWLRYDLNVDKVDEWLAERSTDQPFALVVADHSPHVIWPEKASYSAEEVDIPKKHIDTEETRKSRARYYTDVSKMDRNFGQLMASLKARGLDDNTIVIFTSDQGPQWAFGKWSLYDYGIKAPLIIRWPGKVIAGQRTNALVSHTDILPTLLDAAGGKLKERLDGSSFTKVLKGKKDDFRSYAHASHTGDHQMNRSPSRMVRTKDFKYILNLAPEIEYNTHMNKATDHDGGREYWPSWVARAKTDKHAASVLKMYHHHPAEELYDMRADPWEMNNLAKDARYLKTLNKLRKEMRSWRKQQDDKETGPDSAASNPPAKNTEVPYLFWD